MTIYKGTDLLAGIPDVSGKADDTNVVHLTGTETITGNKTFTGGLTIPAETLVTKQSSLGADEGGEIQFEVGTNSPLLSTVKVDVYQGRFRVFGTASDGVTREIINADIENNNLRAPASDANDSVVTTLSHVFQPLSNRTSYIKLGNGLIIQWGYDGGGTTTHTINWSIPFSSDISYMCIPVTRGILQNVATDNNTATTVQIKTSKSSGVGCIAIGY